MGVGVWHDMYIYIYHLYQSYMSVCVIYIFVCSLQWRNNECNCVLNFQPHDCLLNRLLRWRSKMTSKLRVTGLCKGNSSVTSKFPALRASNAENVSVWWRRQVVCACMALSHWIYLYTNVAYKFASLIWKHKLVCEIAVCMVSQHLCISNMENV